jgi:uncharacterized protein
VGKILLTVLVALIVFWILRNYRRSLGRRDRGALTKPEDMVRCAYCGVHLPRSESVAGGQKFFCTQEHRLLHSR